jgi:RNA polymerase sigma factor (sigma-70 family)
VLKRAGLHFSARNLDSSILTNADHAKKHRLLSKQEEIELGMKIKDGHAAFKELSEFGWKSTAERSELAERIAAGQTAKSYLALMNMRLVASIARSVYKSFPAFNNTSLTFDDLMQEGDVGLLEAIDRYDATKGFRFSTYATWWIRQAMRRSIFNKGSTIRIPIQRSEQIRSLRNASAIFEMENDRPPTAAELAKILKVKEQTAQRVMDIAAQGNTVVPLDKVRRGRQESVLSNIRDRDAVDPLEKLQREEETKRLTEAVAVSIQERLTKEEVVGIGMRYGLYGHEKASFREIADVLGVSSEKSVRKMISNGIQKIKRSVKSNMPSGNHGYDGDVGC